MNEFCSVDAYFSSFLIEFFFNLIFTCLCLLLKLLFNLGDLILLLCFQLFNLIIFFLLLSHCNFDAVFLFDRLNSSKFCFGVFFLKFLSSFIFFVLKSLEVFPNLVHYGFGFRIDLDTLHFKFELRLESTT